jgi:hypothetical protein
VATLLLLTTDTSAPFGTKRYLRELHVFRRRWGWPSTSSLWYSPHGAWSAWVKVRLGAPPSGLALSKGLHWTGGECSTRSVWRYLVHTAVVCRRQRVGRNSPGGSHCSACSPLATWRPQSPRVRTAARITVAYDCSEV